MTETALELYEHFKNHAQYTYSQDLSVKHSEIQAVDELESNGYIRIKARALGFVIADVL